MLAEPVLAEATTLPDRAAPEVAPGPLRKCIATGEHLPPERMIRFVVGPDGDVVPDLARRLPGRGMWLRAERGLVEKAVAKNLFAKAARAGVRAPADLPERIERLLLEGALSDVGRARRAGRAVAGFVKVEQSIGRGQAALLLVPAEAQGDGLDKLRSSGLPIERLGDAEVLGGVFGRDQTVYVAISRDDAGGHFTQRIAAAAARWRGYRMNSAG